MSVVNTDQDPEIPDNIDEDDEDVLVEFFSQQAQALTSLEREPQNLSNYFF